MVVRQRAAVHRARDARIWPLARPRRLHDAGLLAGEQRHGGELRENVQTRLRLFEPARRRGRRHAAAADLVRGLQRERATQRLENEVASREQKSESNRLSVSDFKGATPLRSSQLRRKLGERAGQAWIIRTRRGAGYMLKWEPEQ